MKKILSKIFSTLSIFFAITAFSVVSGQVSLSITTDPVSCVVGRGRIIVSVVSGTSPYTYYLYDKNPLLPGAKILDSLVNTPLLTCTFAERTTATYFVGLIAANGQDLKLVTLAVVQTQALSVPVVTVAQGPTCNNTADAWLEATVSGGNPPYTYKWSAAAAGQTTKIAKNLGQGTYTVTVNDSYNCGPSNFKNIAFFDWNPVYTDSIPKVLTAGTIGTNHSICSGGDPNLLTSITDPTGGRGAYTYDWEYRTSSPVELGIPLVQIQRLMIHLPVCCSQEITAEG
jgi:hypothetical protein